MSKALSIADILAARLDALTALDGVTCLVDRQKDIVSTIAAVVAKTTGCCIIISYEGFENPDRDQSGKPRVTRRYTATVYGRPVLAGPGGKLAADVMEAAAISLHDWTPNESTDGFSEIHVTGGDYRPDSRYLIFDLSIDITSRL